MPIDFVELDGTLQDLFLDELSRVREQRSQWRTEYDLIRERDAERRQGLSQFVVRDHAARLQPDQARDFAL
jgi:hypothetical protein